MTHKIQSEITDSTLWQRVREEDEAALEILYLRHYQVLFRYGMKLAGEKEIAQDCLQEMFFQLWNKRDKLKEVQSVRFYLMKWLKREIFRSINSKHNGPNIISIEYDTQHLQLEAEDLFDKKEALSHNASQIRKAVALLTPREREVIYMRFFLELTYDEICSALNLSYQVVMNYIHRALKALRATKLINNIITLVPFIIASLTSQFFVVGN